MVEKISHGRKYGTLIEAGLVDEVHRFQVPAWKDVPAGRTLTRKEMLGIFEPSAKELPSELRAIVGTTPKAQFWTTTPGNELTPWLDWQLAKLCEQGSFADARMTWLGSLIRSRHLLVTHESFNGQVFFSLGDVCGFAVLGWPADVHEEAGLKYWTMRKITRANHLKWMFITDLPGWKSWVFRWRSPSFFRSSGGLRGIGVAATAVTEPQPLLATAAAVCFWNLGKPTLGHFAKHFGVEACAKGWGRAEGSGFLR